MFETRNGIAYGHFHESRFDPVRRRPVRRMVILMPGQGCVPWLRTEGTCCPFCRLPAGTREAVVGPGKEALFTPWTVSSEDYREMIDAAFAASEPVDEIVVFNGGSFFPDREIPAATRLHLYRAFAAHPTADTLMVESRPEFVRAPALDEAARVIGAKRLKVAIGLESTDDAIRNGPLAKFIGWRSFTSALDLLRERGMLSFVYVFFGAPGLTPEQAYADSLRSVRTLAAMHVDEIALSCAFVPPGGPLEAAWRDGSFRPPTLWDVLRLVTEGLAARAPLSLGGFDDVPPPVAIPANCGDCDAAVHAALDGFRGSGLLDAGALPPCPCREAGKIAAA